MNLLISLVALAVGIGLWVLLVYRAKGLVPFARANMAERRRTLAEQLGAAEASHKRLEEVRADVDRQISEAREQADQIVARSRQEAIAEAEAIRRRGRNDAEAMGARAREDIAAERDRAIQDLRAEVSSAVVDAAGKVLRQAIDKGGHRRLIEESLDKLPDAGEAN